MSNSGNIILVVDNILATLYKKYLTDKHVRIL